MSTSSEAIMVSNPLRRQAEALKAAKFSDSDAAQAAGSEGFSFLRNTNKVGQGCNSFEDKWLCAGARSKAIEGQISAELRRRGHKRQADRRAWCADYLKFHECVESGDSRLVDARFCCQDKLCTFCARRRSVKLVLQYMPKFEELLSDDPIRQGYFVTLTQRNGPDLVERFLSMKAAWTAMQRAGKKARGRGSGGAAFAGVEGGVRSMEIKRGENSGQWHVHIHALLIVDGDLREDAVIREWAGRVGQSVSDTAGGQCVRPIELRARRDEEEQSKAGAFLEVLKYAVKLGDLEPRDVVDVWALTRGKRLVQPFGCLWGMVEPELEDEPMNEEEREFIERLYAWSADGYRLSSQEVVSVD